MPVLTAGAGAVALFLTAVWLLQMHLLVGGGLYHYHFQDVSVLPRYVLASVLASAVLGYAARAPLDTRPSVGWTRTIVLVLGGALELRATLPMLD
jgi:hypothetical protein